MTRSGSACAAFGGIVLALVAPEPARAGVVARIDQSSQRMRVFVNGQLAYIWPVSTARSGAATSRGRWS